MAKRFLRYLGLGLLGLLLLLTALVLWHWAPSRSVEELASRWAPPPSQFIALHGMQVHLRDEGPRSDSVPVVLLHGTSSSLHTWDGWAQALTAQRRVIRYDMPGFGLTGPDPQGDYTIENYVRILVAVLDRLGIDRAVIAGNSLGGYVAWATALLHPERVERLILVDASGYPYQPKSVPLGFRIAQHPVLGPLMRPILPRSVVATSVRNVYGDPSKVTPELIDRYYDMATRAGNREALAARFRQTRPGALAARVPEVRHPTLILWGGQDRLIPPEFGQRFDTEIVGSELAIFDDLGHVPQEEDPQRTVAPVITFLQQDA